MPTPERTAEIKAELKALELQLAQQQTNLSKLPGGCKCTSTGKANAAAKDKYKLEHINPIKDKMKVLTVELHND